MYPPPFWQSSAQVRTLEQRNDDLERQVRIAEVNLEASQRASNDQVEKIVFLETEVEEMRDTIHALQDELRGPSRHLCGCE